MKDLKELDDPLSKVKQVRLVEKLGKQNYQNDVKELFEPITKAVTDSNRKNLRRVKPLQKQLWNYMNQINTLKI